MQIGQDGHGMCTMNQRLVTLVEEGKISHDEALANSPDPEELHRSIDKITIGKKVA
jgi:Tfp pilus assembly ATPase PilU